MASMRKYLGKVKAQKALTRKTTRFGRSVSSQAPGIEGRPPNIKHLIDAELHRIAQARHGKLSNQRLLALDNQARILEILRQAGERRVHATEMVAALAFEHGLESDKLRPHIATCNNLKKRQPELFEGIFANAAALMRENLLERVHDKLLMAGNWALNSVEMAKRLGYDIDSMKKKDRLNLMSKISNALGILDLMKLATKLPVSGGRFHWIHSDHRRSIATIPFGNLGWQLLYALRQRPASITELAHPSMVRGGIVSYFGQIRADSTALGNWLSNLRSAGVVGRRRVTIKGRGGPKHEFYLTDEGLDLLEAQAKRGSLHPTLRKVLLGTYSDKFKPQQRDKYGRIMRWVKVKMAAESNPKLSRRQLGELIGEKKRYLDDVLARNTMPHRNMKLSNLENIFLPEMKRLHPQEAAWFEKWLEAEKKRQKKP